MELEIFRDAEALAKFSNLSAGDVSYFVNNFPDFIPVFWWAAHDGAQVPTYLWQMRQQLLRKAWQKGFPIDESIQLLVGGGQDAVKEFNPASLAEIKVWPYQRAVMFLCVEPWRARLCICGKRFVADKPSRRFCSTKCSAEARKLSRRVWWNEKGKDWRAGQEKKRAPKGTAAKKKKR